ncbi:hypothetical protein Q5P01_005393 [Channa striata]|uniref:Uncharacterized protein n=1 Tax=Channa striata TaxID=64152 RepID=A0AA88SYG6_CHASR|nr:hypothetical protein Q5P01_005393 [Channa striata]
MVKLQSVLGSPTGPTRRAVRSEQRLDSASPHRASLSEPGSGLSGVLRRAEPPQHLGLTPCQVPGQGLSWRMGYLLNPRLCFSMRTLFFGPL